MECFKGMSPEELAQMHEKLSKELEEIQGLGLQLNMARGKPCKEQVDLSESMLWEKIDYSIKSDYRNYGILDGIEELKDVYANVLRVSHDELIIGGNSSLNLMYDTLVRGMMFGLAASDTPWNKEDKVKFLCPVPGYDRHFSICEALGIEMISIEMDENGPDMNRVEALVYEDASIKGIWCVPKYSNPSGISYSDDVVKRLATMKTAAKDFVVMWDNAYIVHDLYDSGDEVMDIFAYAKEMGTEDRILMFTSTSKITFPGAGIGMVAGSVRNADEIRYQMGFQTIGHDKINQLMHARFLSSAEAIDDHMKKHAAIIAPKFQLVDKLLTDELSGYGLAEWTRPRGGYFISMDLNEGCAKEVVDLCKDCGVTLTGAGATYPYKKDPKDANIRIAPTFPPIDELEQAIRILCLAIKFVALKKLLNK